MSVFCHFFVILFRECDMDQLVLASTAQSAGGTAIRDERIRGAYKQDSQERGCRNLDRICFYVRGGYCGPPPRNSRLRDHSVFAALILRIRKRVICRRGSEANTAPEPEARKYKFTLRCFSTVGEILLSYFCLLRPPMFRPKFLSRSRSNPASVYELERSRSSLSRNVRLRSSSFK
jgi:hypothetical protein